MILVNEGSFKRVKAIAKKEVVEFTRDWRTIIAIIVIPILMFPLLFIMFPLLLESEAAELDSIVVDIVIQSDETPTSLMEEFNTTSIIISEENLTQKSPLSEPGNDLDRLRSLSVDAILRVEKREDAWYYAILHISTSESSNEARSRIIDGIISWEVNETERIISEQGLDVNSTLNPVRWDGDVSQGDVATQGEQAGMVLSLFH